MALRPSIVAISFAAGLLVVAASLSPAAAQQDDRFYGRWEPSKKGAPNLYLDPAGSGGYLSYLGANGRYQVEQYEIIRDFGDHVVVKVWWLADELHAKQPPDVAILDLRDSRPRVPSEWRSFIYSYCGGGPSTEYFFQDNDPDSIWQRIQEWSARSDEGRPYDSCSISPSGNATGQFWSRMNWSRLRD